MPLRPSSTVLLAMLAASPAVADDRASAIHWACGLSADLVRLVCVADVEPHRTEAPPAVTAVVNGRRFPLDARRTYTVDLWSPPTELAFVEQLARATICYRSPGCEVSVASPWLAAIIDPRRPDPR
jgi:hypothetical protein